MVLPPQIYRLALATIFLMASFPADVLASHEVQRIRVDGIINPVTTKFILDGVVRAEADHAEALIIELDTPGGLLESTREIVQSFLSADVPIIVYVSPDGARAGSAGVFITLASHIAVMAPSTNIGAAHPVSIGGGALPGQQSDSAGSKILTDKVTNDAVALIRSIAETRDRNVEWAEKAVRSSDAITALDAKSRGVVNLIAPNIDSLLVMIDGMTVRLKGGERTLSTIGVTVKSFEMTWRERLFDKLSDPNIAYIFMMIGIYGVLFELYSPGAILPGVLGVLGLLLSFFAFQTLPVNAVGLLLILTGVVLLIMEIKVTSYGLLTIAGGGSLFLGSIMLFDASLPMFRVSMGVIIPTVFATTLFVLFALGMGLRAQKRKIETGAEALSGMIGISLANFETHTGNIDAGLNQSNFSGNILVNGEYWRAVSPDKILKDDKVRVSRIEGMTLFVQKSQ